MRLRRRPGRATGAAPPRPAGPTRRRRRWFERSRPSWERRPPLAGAAATPGRFAAHARQQRLRRLVPWLWATLGVAAAAGLVWLVGWSSVLTLHAVEVHGADDATAEAVEQAMDAPLGVPLARLDLAALDRSAEEVDAVAAVEVTRVWPRSLRVDVRSRVPAAAVRLGDRWRYVDAAGAVFGRLDGQPKGLTVVDVAADSATEEQTVAAMTVLRALPDAVRDRLETVRVASAADVRLILDDGATVVWGTAERSARKAEVLEALLPVEARGYDVSAPDRPALRGVPMEPDQADERDASE